jgi:S-DNA-T family DNA segregation ATPase FtsK/SpoIIIE
MDKLLFRGKYRVGTFVFGALLLIAAALLCVSLLQALFSLDTAASPLFWPGEVLFSVYGFSSFLLPLYMLCAAILLLIPGGTFKSAILLVGSVIPFFTAVAGERLIKNFALTLGSPGAVTFVAVGLVVSTFLVMVVEYVGMLWIADIFVKSPVSTAVEIPLEEAASDTPAVAPPVEESLVDGTENDFSGIKEISGTDGDAVPESYSGTSSPAELPLEEIHVPDGAVRGTTDSDYLAASSAANASTVTTPTYVDFEKMKAPFDLPVIEDWVEPAVSEPATDDSAFKDSPAESLPEEFSRSEAIVSSDDSLPDDDLPVADLSVDELPDDEVSSHDALDETEFDIDLDIDDEGHAIVEEDLSVDEASDDLDIELIDEDEDSFDDVIEAAETAGPDALNDVDDAAADIDETFDSEDPSELPPVVTVPPAPRDADSSNGAAEKGNGLLAAAAAALPFVKKNWTKNYAVPYDILTSYPDGEYWVIDDSTRRAAVALKETLNEFRIQADVTGIRKGPVITMFEILPAPGVKLSKIVGLQDNIALRLAASSVRIVAPIPGKHAVGIEVPNQKRAIVSFRELIESDIPSAKKMEIPVVLGKDITGEAQLLDLASTPHLLIAGSTGSGKSVCVNSIILSILYKRSPEDVKLILIDPKIVELKLYNDIGHLLSPVITEPKKAFQSLQYCLCEMERRYALLDGMGVRDIKSYNKRIRERNIAAEKIPYLVVIIDEFADLMATTGKELESTVARLCAMSRAVGIHLVLATQRPSIDVITGLIKANIPTRIAFMVASKMDSRIIIDQVGAEKLLGKGDMLYASATDPFPVRIQGAFVSEEEVERVVEHVKSLGEPEYIDEEIFVDDDEDEVVDPSLFSDGEDPLYDKALEIVLLAGKASASYIQRRLKIGYNRAARLVEDMEARGIVGPANGSKPRDVIHHV